MHRWIYYIIIDDLIPLAMDLSSSSLGGLDRGTGGILFCCWGSEVTGGEVLDRSSRVVVRSRAHGVGVGVGEVGVGSGLGVSGFSRLSSASDCIVCVRVYVCKNGYVKIKKIL